MTRPSRRMRWLLLLPIVLATAAALLITLRSREVYATIGQQQTAAYFHEGPPPWPNGNGFWVKPRWMILRERGSSWVRQRWPLAEHLPGMDKLMSPAYSEGWGVANMHAENFNAFRQQQGIDWVKVEKLSEGVCVVTDARVPREWLLTYPGGYLDPAGLRLRLERPEHFHTDAWVQALIGSRWELVERVDHDRWLERLLPGEWVEFADVQLSCHSRSATRPEGRLWQSAGQGKTGGLAIYDTAEDGSWTAIGGSLTVEDDTLTFTLNSTSRGAHQEASSSFYDPAKRLIRATYRRLNAPVP